MEMYQPPLDWPEGTSNFYRSERGLGLGVPQAPYVTNPCWTLPPLEHVDNLAIMRDAALIRELNSLPAPLKYLGEDDLPALETDKILEPMVFFRFRIQEDNRYEYYEYGVQYWLCDRALALRKLFPNALSYYDLMHATYTNAVEQFPHQQGEIAEWLVSAENLGIKLFGPEQCALVEKHRQ